MNGAEFVETAPALARALAEMAAEETNGTTTRLDRRPDDSPGGGVEPDLRGVLDFVDLPRHKDRKSTRLNSSHRV